MKSFIMAIMLFVASLVSAADFTNGFVYVDAAVECHQITQNGTITNSLPAGKTVAVSDKIVEFVSPTNLNLHFSGGPLIGIGTNTEFSINLYEVEIVKPQESRKATFGSHNLNLMLTRGDFSILYPNPAEGSAFTVSTPYTSYELQGGKYFFRVTDKSAVVYVLEGAMNVHGDKKVDKTSKGNLAVAVPYDDPVSGVSDKVVTSVKQLKQEETSRFVSPVVATEQEVGKVVFYIIDGKSVGIRP